MNISPENRLILASVKIKPSQAELDHLNDLILIVTDWVYLAENIINRGIAPLLFKKLHLLPNAELIPESARTKLRQAYYLTLSRSMVLYEAFKKVAETYYSNDIQVIALKGIYLSEWLYNDIGLRQFSDIDLLINVLIFSAEWVIKFMTAKNLN